MIVVEPAGTKALTGTESACEPLDRFTLTPPEPAAWVSVTVHVDVPADAKTFGLHNRVDKAGAAGLDPMVVSNSTGGSPFTSAITLTTDPALPAPNVKVTEAWP